MEYGHHLYPYAQRIQVSGRRDRLAQSLRFRMGAFEYNGQRFCVDALERALLKGTPDVFNTDQGSQVTSSAFTEVLLKQDISISMDGRGRARDNVFIERLWWTVKYEKVKQRLKTKGGRALYNLRKQTVEPVFGIIKEIIGFRRFSMRGLEKANLEWTLVCLSYNMEKLFKLREAYAQKN